MRSVDWKNTALHRADGAEFDRERAGVDAGQTRHFLLGEECFERSLALGAGRLSAEFGADQRRGERAARLIEFAIDAVIADERIRQRDDLSAIRRIGENILIAFHAGIKNDFAESGVAN